MSEALPALTDQTPAGELPVFRGESWEDHVSGWAQVEDEMQDRLWMLAAIAASLTTVYGDQSVGAFASEVGCSARRVYDYAATYKAWESRRRSQILSFHHHTVAARAPEPEAAIERAEVEEMSTRELEREIRGEEEKGAQEVQTMTCPRCGGSGEVAIERD